MSYSSLPYFLHELDPTYLGYLDRDEVRDLLRNLLATDLSGTRLEQAWVHAMLLRHLAQIDDHSCQLVSTGDAGASLARSTYDRKQLEVRLKDALPRLEDKALRQDLEQVVSMLKRERRSGDLRR